MSDHELQDMASSSTGLLFNFRDVGGVDVRGGGHVVADRLFRSGHHAGLSEPERQRLLTHEFGVIVDLRYPDERAKDVSPWPIDWSARVVSHARESGKAAPHIALLTAADHGVQAVHQAYRALYETMPFDPTYRALFAHAATRMAETDTGVLIHCSAGKDRTGVLVALLLDLLAVRRDAIVADYLLSATAPALLRVSKDLAATLDRKGNIAPDVVAAALTGVRVDYLDAMFAAVDGRYGSTEAYWLASGVPDGAIAMLKAGFVHGRPLR